MRIRCENIRWWRAEELNRLLPRGKHTHHHMALRP